MPESKQGWRVGMGREEDEVRGPRNTEIRMGIWDWDGMG